MFMDQNAVLASLQLKEGSFYQNKKKKKKKNWLCFHELPRQVLKKLTKIAAPLFLKGQ
jgi:hypothetical protein